MTAAPSTGIDALVRRAADWLVGAGAVVLAVVMLMTFFDVVGRELLNAPIVGTVDMTELYMGLIVYLGIGATTYSGAHISVDIVTQRLPARLRRVLGLFSQIVCAALAGLICWQLWIIAGETVDYNDVTRVWEMPIYPVVYGMAAASVLMVVAFVLQVAQSLRTMFVGQQAQPNHGLR